MRFSKCNIIYAKRDFKSTVQDALKSEYGFAPKLSEIELLECTSDRTYIMFRVNGKQYQFRSYIARTGIDEATGKPYESIWIGRGTIERYEN